MLLKEIVKEAVKEELEKLSLAVEQKYIKGIDNLAKFLSISKSVVQKMKNDGVIPYVQYDRVVLFSPDEV
jgi:Mn-dependent DtxR family transcriptional regulator